MEINPADGLERPHRISTTAGWDTGTYAYDGAGNIHRIGTENFRYDRLSRLVSGQVKVGVSLRAQTAAFDVYGNITSLTTNGSVQSTPTDPTTNRLQSPLASYDGGGNVTVLDYGSERYEYSYDGTNMMKYLKSDTGLARTFLYSADDERVVQLDCETAGCGVDDAKHTWSLRGLGAEVLRTYTLARGGGWNWERDYVHRGGQSLASVGPSGTLHFHPDHLGTPRQLTRSTGAQESLHSYYPFGQEATNIAQDDVTLKFTGHERDSNDNTVKGHLDYMHARFCSANLGRFNSPDPIPMHQSATRNAQRWNRYLYAAGNPLKFTDPSGLYIVVPGAKIRADGEDELEAVQQALIEAQRSDLADRLILDVVDGEVRIAYAGNVDDLTGSGNATAALIGETIKTQERVALDITTSSLSEFGGARTYSAGVAKGGVPEIDIRINPGEVSSTIVPGTPTAGPLAGANVGLGVSLGTAVVHEFGHASGYLLYNMPRIGTNTSSDALYYENLHRELLAKPGGGAPLKRTRH
jgi:RHS repeat-associated protein